MTRVLMDRCRVRKLDDENFAGVGVDREMVELAVLLGFLMVCARGSGRGIED